MKIISQTNFFNASPAELYQAILDPKIHSAFTNSKATNSMKEGGKFTAYDDYIWGTNTLLEKDKKIVQQWTSTDIPEGYYTEVTFAFKKSGRGTQLSFKQKNVPDDSYDELAKGWEDFYWTPLREMFPDKK